MRLTSGLIALGALPLLVLAVPAGCPSGQIMCGDGKCYDAKYGCVGKRDNGCPSGQAMCGDGKCYDARWGCVGKRSALGCPSGQTMCEDGKCYDAKYGCVGKRETQDNGCPSGQTMCGDGKCYDARWGCVGKRDLKAADACPKGEILCNGKCITQYSGIACIDDSSSSSVKARSGCPSGQTMCEDGKCYDARYGCVGKREVQENGCPVGEGTGCPGKKCWPNNLPCPRPHDLDARASCPVGQTMCEDGKCYDARYGCVGKRSPPVCPKGKYLCGGRCIDAREFPTCVTPVTDSVE
ncbi:hypothetical protein PG995_015794 [Apiospora arundinis]